MFVVRGLGDVRLHRVHPVELQSPTALLDLPEVVTSFSCQGERCQGRGDGGMSGQGRGQAAAGKNGRETGMCGGGEGEDQEREKVRSAQPNTTITSYIIQCE